MMRFISILFFSLLFFLSSVFAEVKINPLFTDNMVLQRDMKVPVYGTADNGEKVTVEIKGEISSKSGMLKIHQKLVTTAKDGKWKASFKPMKAGGPYTITISGENKIVLKNVLVGDVWICGGQSNMYWSLKALKGEEIINSSRNRNIRLMMIAITGEDAPSKNVPIEKSYNGSWQECGPEYSVEFSAVGYFFGKKLQQELGVPIGLIRSCVGGTSAELWTSKEVLGRDPAFKDIIKKSKTEKKVTMEEAMAKYEKQLEKYNERIEKLKEKHGKDFRKVFKRLKKKKKGQYSSPKKPKASHLVKRVSALYYGMICPLQPFAIKGVIWYQGEGNSRPHDRALQYRKLFPAMIKNWRDDWGQEDFPFLFVQLAAFRKMNPEPEDASWSWLQEAQTKTLSLKNTGMALAIDAGEERNIHPKKKKIVGDRLVFSALKVAYNQENTSPGPMYAGMKVQGSKIVISFKNTGKGLVAKDVTLDTYKVSGKELKGFAICGKNRKFEWAKAEIKGGTVIVLSDTVKHPVAVRYAWARFPICNLYNKDGFPAVPFRTDNFSPIE